MRHELTSAQAREIALLRRRHPQADIAVERHLTGVTVEARSSGRTLELLRADYYGRCDSAAQLPHVA